MDRMIFIAMNGAKEMMNAQAINTNNLANASTAGFKADFQTSLSQQVYGPGQPSRVYASASNAGVDMSRGNIVSTGRELDMAINGDGWFAVQTEDGSEAYTRAGDLRIDNLGQVTNGAGQIIKGNGGPITVPEYAKLEIGSDGTISILPPGQPINTMAVIDRIKLVSIDDDQLEKGSDGLMRRTDGQTATPDAKVSIVSGSLESSNVNAVGAMVKMIELARQYETYIKLMSTAQENDKASAELIKMA